MKKVLVLFLLFALLIPNIVFAEELNNVDNEQGKITNNELVGNSSQVEDEKNVNDQNIEMSEGDQNNEQPTDENNENDQHNEDPQSTTLLPAQIKNLTVTAKGVDSCRAEWEFVDCSKVHLKYSYGDVNYETTNTSGGYSVTKIPFGETITFEISTDNEHEVMIATCNPSEDYRPVKIEYEDYKIYSSTYKSLERYYSDIKVLSKNGNRIYSNYFDVSSSKKLSGPGIYNMTIKFKDKFENYQPLNYTLKIIPSTPSISYFSDFQSLGSLKFYVTTKDDQWDKAIIEMSTHKDYSNPIKKTISKPKDKNYVYPTITGLNRNTTYYTRVRLVKADGDKNVYSEYMTEVMHTIKPAPTYSYNQTNVKEILSLMKKNKSFKYTFNGYYSYSDISDFVGNITDDFPQYAGNYSRSVSFGKGKITFEYKVNTAKIKNNAKLAKKINSIANGAKKKKGVKNKVKYINKQMCKICRYDYDTYRHNKKASDQAYTAYGCLVRGKAVCSGYAKAFHAICVQCGIQDKYAYGKNHIWNKVKVGKKWLHVDVTWNDCTHSTKYLLKSSHK